MSTSDLPSLPKPSAEAADVRAPAFPLATGSAASRPGDRGVWSIGDPPNPTQDDAVCGSEEFARRCASEMSTTRVMAVWHGPDLIALYFEGQPWRRA